MKTTTKTYSQTIYVRDENVPVQCAVVAEIHHPTAQQSMVTDEQQRSIPNPDSNHD
jgi:hypothetical protein